MLSSKKVLQRKVSNSGASIKLLNKQASNVSSEDDFDIHNLVDSPTKRPIEISSLGLIPEDGSSAAPDIKKVKPMRPGALKRMTTDEYQE